MYHLVMTFTVRHGKSSCLIGKPSISMGHGFHGELLINQRVYTVYHSKHGKNLGI